MDGAGKSVLAVSTLDYVLEREENAVTRRVQHLQPGHLESIQEILVPAELIDLDEADDWIDLVNTCDTHRDSLVVVNTAARNNVSVRTTPRPSAAASMS